MDFQTLLGGTPAQCLEGCAWETRSTMCRNGVAEKWNSMNVNESKAMDVGQVEHW